MKNIFYLVFSLFFIACAETPDYKDCIAFCDLMDLLTCPERLGSPGVDSDYSTSEDNTSCEDLCELYIDVVTIDCYLESQTCEEMRDCE